MPGPDWESRYAAAPNGLFGAKVNGFVAAMASQCGLVGPRVLCLADGDGRNGRWLAREGYAVTAVDLSEVATGNGRRLDLAANVHVHRLVCDLADGLPDGLGLFDTAILIYLQAPWPVRQRAIGDGLAALEPGGRLIIEGFARWPTAQMTASAPLGPAADGLRYAVAELQQAVGSHTIERAETVEIDLDEGDRHQGRAFVLRAVIRRS